MVSKASAPGSAPERYGKPPKERNGGKGEGGKTGKGEGRCDGRGGGRGGDTVAAADVDGRFGTQQQQQPQQAAQQQQQQTQQPQTQQYPQYPQYPQHPHHHQVDGCHGQPPLQSAQLGSPPPYACADELSDAYISEQVTHLLLQRTHYGHT